MRAIVIAGLLFGLSALAQENTLTIDTTKPGKTVSPMLWGVFFEEINHSGDGGLYAEMVRNRGFEDNQVPPGCTVADNQFVSPTGWKLKMGDQAEPHPGWKTVADKAEAALALDTANPINPVSITYGRLTVSRLDAGGRAGLANDGYWGMSVKEGETYNLSLFLRAEGAFTGSITAALESADGAKTYATATLPAPGAGWTRPGAALKSSGSDNQARLALYLSGPGAVCFDMVSLFPATTFKNRPNGLRPDLAQMVADLKPAFIRFPGGCIVEGFTPESAWRWKETIGDIAQRTGRQNLWGYRASDGLGYHEFLQFAEDIGAAPIVVVNCGMTCQGRNPILQPLDALQPWIQEALDAIEYANGGAETAWGARRAENGHPKPFHLKFITIGNENGGPDYLARYAKFAEAVRAKYPEIKLVGNFRMEKLPVDFEEHHYYATPNWFCANAGKYDNYDRNLPQVFVSEYAANQQCGKGNLEGAVGESAFMIGLENNSDVTAMAAYAPLFNHEHNREWPVNLIVFNNHHGYGIPSYYAQKMFAENRPDTLLDVQYDTASTPLTLKGGRVGLGSWETSVEYKDIKVAKDGETLYEFKPERGLKGMDRYDGDWEVADNMLRQKDLGVNRAVQFGSRKWTDYAMTLKARKLAGKEGFLVLFRSVDRKNWHWVNFGGWGNTAHGIETLIQNDRAGDYPRVPGSIETGRWYDIRVEVAGDNIRVFLDGKQLFDEKECVVNTPGLKANAGRVTATGEYIVKVANYTGAPYKTTVKLSGITGPLAGTKSMLAAASRTEENSLAAPDHVVPQSEAFTVPGPEFPHEFPACSLTILRIKP